MKEFFGIGGYTRVPEGYLSWQHLTFVTSVLIVMTLLAVFIGRKQRGLDEKNKNRVLLWAAILINFFETFKTVMVCVNAQDAMRWLYELPLFLCSIQLIAIPMAAFCKGRVKEACMDFVLTFGILGAIFGTVGATQNYSAYPVLSMDNMFSAITHSISGFASLYIAISGLISLKKKNLIITSAILAVFSVLAYVVNILIDYNYMFLMSHDGTPYSIFYNMVGGSPILYPLTVVGVFFVYLILFYCIYNAIKAKKEKRLNDSSTEIKETANV